MSNPDYDSALHFAEGWLSGEYSGLYFSALAGARYQNYPLWAQPKVVWRIAKEMKARGLYQGCGIDFVEEKYNEQP